MPRLSFAQPCLQRLSYGKHLKSASGALDTYREYARLRRSVSAVGPGAVEESPLRLTFGPPLESEAEATRGFPQRGALVSAKGSAPGYPDRRTTEGFNLWVNFFVGQLPIETM